MTQATAPTAPVYRGSKAGAANVSYATFKQALLTLYEQGKEGAEEGDFQVLSRGMQLLNELGKIFPAYATRLADDPEFLS